MRYAIHKPDPRAEFPTEEKCFILKIINTPDDPRVSIARARVPPGGETVRHRLDGVSERYYLLTGRGVVTLGSGVTHELAAGEGVTIPAGVSQQIRNIGTEDLVFLCICTPRFVQACYVELDT